MHRHSVPVLDRTSGKITDRDSGTPTLDVPSDFDRTARLAWVDARARARYISTSGSTVVNLAYPRPLSWRIHGEECLVAGAKGEDDETPYRLCIANPSAP